MNNLVVAVTSPSFSKNKYLREALQKLPVEVHYYQEERQASSEILANYLNSIKAEAVIVGLEKINDQILDKNPQLKLISKYGVGLDNIDLNIINKYDVKLGVSSGVNKNSVVELVMTFSLGHSRNVFNSMNLLSAGQWVKNGGKELINCKFGIVGLGNIGTLLAKKLKAIGLNDIYYSDVIDKSEIEKDLGITYRGYEDILKNCDIISFHVPLNPSTKFMLSNNEIKLLKPDALIINTARGEIIDIESCCDAVINKKIGGLACDVFPHEPYDTSKYKNMPNLYLTPHIGGNSIEAITNMGMASILHVEEYLKNKYNELKLI
ncbi:hypothetical protein GCL60_13300 [Silvanigrella paludirubra]|uniref:Hydroxyacid dehydrogenase n=1 Tax=Silvanigrella paludirubra TaxID=2499159 RepID=A0A6N6VSI4_9BACT|nr:NAD(P)-dependent oxidoreductase [Silvanigrella paludirubra]KAB8036815.1 hypothetical protein GCL60_13300 [Silvanigrella paludirubra]